MLARTCALLISLLMNGCSTLPVENSTLLFSARPTYPDTQISVSTSLTLVHVAGPPCDYFSTARPQIGTEGDRSYSEYQLRDLSKDLVLQATPSILSDPKYLGEFEEYHRKNDLIRVFISKSGDTILVAEDGSSAIPVSAHIVIRREAKDVWNWFELRLPMMQPDGPPLYRRTPDVVGITDDGAWLKGEAKQWFFPFPRASQTPNKTLVATGDNVPT